MFVYNDNRYIIYKSIYENEVNRKMECMKVYTKESKIDVTNDVYCKRVLVNRNLYVVQHISRVIYTKIEGKYAVNVLKFKESY